MTTIFEVASTNYGDDILQIKKALSHLQTTCGVSEGYFLSEPISKFGWTFFKLLLKPDFNFSIEKIFSDMIFKYKGKKEEKFTSFMSDFFESRGCKIKVKQIES
jgi:hypothetical protein